MSTTLYERRGRRYYPVAANDDRLWNSLTVGHHLVTVTDSGRMVRHNINPAHAETLAAVQDCHHELCAAMLDAMRGAPASERCTRYPCAADVLDVLAAKLAALVEQRRKGEVNHE